MAIQMLRCDKHGIVKHSLGYKCEICASESAEALKPDAQQLKVAIGLLLECYKSEWRWPIELVDRVSAFLESNGQQTTVPRTL